MVFHKKLPGAAPRPRRSAQELAHELNVHVSVVLDALQTTGEFVTSRRRKEIEEPAVRKVYAHLGRAYTSEPAKGVSPWRFRDTRSPDRTIAPARAHQPQADAASSYESKDTSAGLGDKRSDTADAWAYQEWKMYGFSAVERDVWIDAGLRRGQAKFARDLLEAGLAPSDLGIDVLGWSVAKRLREGEPPHEVVRDLERARASNKAL